MTSVEQRRALGAFVRAQRDKLAPGTIGVPPGTRRRTPGLRREEVAQLCGFSPTWYTWIEQGRDVSMSAPALVRLARGLRLTRAERGHLFELAGKRDPEHDDSPGEAIPTAVLASLQSMTAPAYLLDRSWTARGWNAPAERLFAGWLDQPGDRNLLRFIFLEPDARRLILRLAGPCAPGGGGVPRRVQPTSCRSRRGWPGRRTAAGECRLHCAMGPVHGAGARRRRADVQSSAGWLPALSAGELHGGQPCRTEAHHADRCCAKLNDISRYKRRRLFAPLRNATGRGAVPVSSDRRGEQTRVAPAGPGRSPFGAVIQFARCHGRACHGRA